MQDERETRTKLRGGEINEIRVGSKGKDTIVNYERRDPWRRCGGKEKRAVIPEMQAAQDGVK